MPCSHCASTVVAFAVPPALREHAPGTNAAICTRCLRTSSAADAGVAVTGSAGPDLSAVDPAFPDGEAGIALALLCGSLESVALNRSSISALVEHAERSGADVFAFLDRLDATEAVFDLDRRRATLLDVL